MNSKIRIFESKKKKKNNRGNNTIGRREILRPWKYKQRSSLIYRIAYILRVLRDSTPPLPLPRRVHGRGNTITVPGAKTTLDSTQSYPKPFFTEDRFDFEFSFVDSFSSIAGRRGSSFRKSKVDGGRHGWIIVERRGWLISSFSLQVHRIISHSFLFKFDNGNENI